MAGSHYCFVTNWAIPAPQERVWEALMRPEEWPDWWRGVERVELLKTGYDDLGRGAVRRYTWKSRLPYRLTFIMETTVIAPQSRIEGVASGELQGSGVWQLSHADGMTHVQYDWQVETTKAWMRLFAPIARPLFEWNHDVVMDWGRIGLLRRVGAKS